MDYKEEIYKLLKIIKTQFDKSPLIDYEFNLNKDTILSFHLALNMKDLTIDDDMLITMLKLNNKTVIPEEIYDHFFRLNKLEELLLSLQKEAICGL